MLNELKLIQTGPSVPSSATRGKESESDAFTASSASHLNYQIYIFFHLIFCFLLDDVDYKVSHIFGMSSADCTTYYVSTFEKCKLAHINYCLDPYYFISIFKQIFPPTSFHLLCFIVFHKNGVI